MSKKPYQPPLKITVDNSLTRKKNKDSEAEKQRKKEKKAKKKEEKKKLKKELGQKLKKQLESIDHTNPQARNPVIIKIVENYLGRSVQVFENQWQHNTLLSNEILLNTPIFWFKKHKWKHTDVRDFYEIMSLKRANLESQLIQTYKLDADGKPKKKKKKGSIKKESKIKVRGKRESSLRLMRGRSLLLLDYSKLERETLEIWIKLVKSRGATAKEVPELNHPQFNICMNDNDIQIDPDLSVTLFWSLVTTYDRKKAVKKSANILTPTSINEDKEHDEFPEMKEKKEEKEITTADKTMVGQIMKERAKRIKKAKITPKHIKYIIKSIEKYVSREDLIANPATLNEKTRNMVIFSKIFENIQSGQSFDIINDYLSQRLGADVLNDPEQCLQLLETRNADWKHRVQVMQWIEQNLDQKASLQALFEEENFDALVLGWTTQLYDDRSNVTKPAAELFPSLLAICLTEMDDPSVLFDENNKLWQVTFESLFVLLRNKRAKVLAQIAKTSIIQVVDILASIVQDIDKSLYNKMMQLFINKAQIKNEKHEAVRAGCVSLAAYLIFGVERPEPVFLQNLANIQVQKSKNIPFIPKSQSLDVSMPSPLVSDDESKEDTISASAPSSPAAPDPEPLPTKICKFPQRAFLLEDKEFLKLIGKIVEIGIGDKAKETRDETMKFLQLMDTKKYVKMLEDTIDPISWKKYEKWKKYNSPKKKGKKKKNKRKRIPISKQMRKMKSGKDKKKNKKKDENGDDVMPDMKKSKSADVASKRHSKKRISLVANDPSMKESVEKYKSNLEAEKKADD